MTLPRVFASGVRTLNYLLIAFLPNGTPHVFSHWTFPLRCPANTNSLPFPKLCFSFFICYLTSPDTFLTLVSSITTNILSIHSLNKMLGLFLPFSGLQFSIQLVQIQFILSQKYFLYFTLIFPWRRHCPCVLITSFHDLAFPWLILSYSSLSFMLYASYFHM